MAIKCSPFNLCISEMDGADEYDSKGENIMRNTRSKFGIAVVAAIASIIFMSSAVAGVKCRTDESGCSGRVKFENNSNIKKCLSIFYKNGSIQNMCIEPGGKGYAHVRYGDKVCWSKGDYAPKTNCNKEFIWTE